MSIQAALRLIDARGFGPEFGGTPGASGEANPNTKGGAGVSILQEAFGGPKSSVFEAQRRGKGRQPCPCLGTQQPMARTALPIETSRLSDQNSLFTPSLGPVGDVGVSRQTFVIDGHELT